MVSMKVPQDLRKSQKEILMDFKQPLKCNWQSGLSLETLQCDAVKK